MTEPQHVEYPPQVDLPFQLMYPPCDLPTGIRAGVVDVTGGERRVLLEIHDATGVKLVVLRHEVAGALAQQLGDLARQARSGLVVAHGGGT